MCRWSWGGIRRCPSVTNPTICYGSQTQREVSDEDDGRYFLYIFNILPSLSLKYSRESRDQAERKKKKQKRKLENRQTIFFFLFRDSLDLPHLTHSSSHLVEPIITGSSRSICCTAHIHSSHHKSEGKRDVIKHQSHGDAHLFQVRWTHRRWAAAAAVIVRYRESPATYYHIEKGQRSIVRSRSLYIIELNKYTTISYWCSLIHRCAACSS